MGLLNVLRTTPKEHIINWIYATIEKYHLSLVSKNGYEFYHCESSTGLGEYNKKGFNQLRETFNAKENMDAEYFLMLYLLIVYSFNNQLRFNGKGKFNLPVGKRDFNKKMQSKFYCNNIMSIMLLLILYLCFCIFTFFPPHIALFKDPITGMFGIPK